MKYPKFLAAVFTIAFFTLTSCEKDFLERKPQGQLTAATFFTDADGAMKAVNAIYDMLRNFEVHANAFVAISSIRSDDADKGSVPGDAPLPTELDNFTFNAGNGFVNTYWSGLYKGVGRCNVVLQNLPAIQMEEPLKQRLLGEARFLRAYFYFNLVRTYGDVPIVDHLLAPSEFNMRKSSADSVYQFIRQDLAAAINALPEKSQYPAADLGRATRGAAKGLLAKVHLYQKNWAEVVKLTEEIMKSGEYDLSTPYHAIFFRQGENGRESVFEVQNASDPQRLGLSQYGQFQGIRSATLNLGFGLNVPSPGLVNAYEPGDPRKEATLLVRGADTGFGELVPLDATQPFFSKKAYTPPVERNAWDVQGGGKNIRLLRYADIVLMNAEANNELGQAPKALVALNEVRARARGNNPVTILPALTTTDQEELRNKIRHERRIELAMEHERFYDLVRWGIAEQVLHAAGKTNFQKNKNELLPIPQVEIDKTQGALKQNPGY